MERSSVAVLLLISTLPLTLMYNEEECQRALNNVNIRQCCNMPRLLPKNVVDMCRKRPLPPVPPEVAKPISSHCQAECALNVTRVLLNFRFRIKQAEKVVAARITNATSPWLAVIKEAVKKCYDMQVSNIFYLQYVAKNQISPQCIPSSLRFLECTFSIMYRDCPDEYWNSNEEICEPLVTALNECNYLFQLEWDI